MRMHEGTLVSSGELEAGALSRGVGRSLECCVPEVLRSRCSPVITSRAIAPSSSSSRPSSVILSHREDSHLVLVHLVLVPPRHPEFSSPADQPEERPATEVVPPFMTSLSHEDDSERRGRERETDQDHRDHEADHDLRLWCDGRLRLQQDCCRRQAEVARDRKWKT